jgi:hypothetical protein
MKNIRSNGTLNFQKFQKNKFIDSQETLQTMSNSQIASLSIQISSLSSTDNELLQSLKLYFDKNATFQENAPNQKNLDALDQN